MFLPVGKWKMVPVHERGEIGHKPAFVGRTAVYHILPYEDAELVAVIVKTFRLELGVLAQHIEAQLLHAQDIRGEGFIRRCGVKAFGPVALVEHARLKIGLIVQKKSLFSIGGSLDIAFAHGKIAGNPVSVGADADLIAKGVLRAPRVKPGQADSNGFIGHTGDAEGIHILSRNHAVDFNGVFGHDAQVHPAIVIIRGEKKLFDIVVRYDFSPYRLPDAALGGIEHTSG